MSDVNVQLVCEYFELHNFLVKRGHKYTITRDKKDKEPPVDLFVHNLKYINPHTKDFGVGAKPTQRCGFVLLSKELPLIQNALVQIKGWHSERFAPSVLKASSYIFNFTKQRTLRLAADFFGDADFKKILVISRLPAGKEMREKSINFLLGKGIDHVIEFATILKVLINTVKVNKNYTGSDLLQLLRLLKQYKLFKTPQLEMF